MTSLRKRIAEQTANLRSASDIPLDEAKKDSRPKTGPGSMAAFAKAQVRIQELEARGGPLTEIPLADIDPNPWQPRTKLTQETLDTLAENIVALGLIQPILVRPTPGQVGKYQVVAGEHRVRATRQLGWTTIPGKLAEVTDEDMACIALGKTNLARPN